MALAAAVTGFLDQGAGKCGCPGRYGRGRPWRKPSVEFNAPKNTKGAPPVPRVASRDICPIIHNLDKKKQRGSKTEEVKQRSGPKIAKVSQNTIRNKQKNEGRNEAQRRR